MPATPRSPHSLARAGLFAALVLLGAGACHSTAPSHTAGAVSTLRVENHSDFVWRMELAPDAHGVASPDALRWELPARGKQNVTVPAGVYHLRSRLADAANENAPAASERIYLRAGATLIWPLASPP